MTAGPVLLGILIVNCSQINRAAGVAVRPDRVLTRYQRRRTHKRKKNSMIHTDARNMTNPHAYWAHCAQEWKNVADGAHEAGNLPQEMLYKDLADSARYMDRLLGS